MNDTTLIYVALAVALYLIYSGRLDLRALLGRTPTPTPKPAEPAPVPQPLAAEVIAAPRADHRIAGVAPAEMLAGLSQHDPNALYLAATLAAQRESERQLDRRHGLRVAEAGFQQLLGSYRSDPTKSGD